MIDKQEIGKQRIFVVTGPAGVGKSTVSAILAHYLNRSAYIPGDVIYDLVVGSKVDAGTSGDAAAPYYELLYRNLSSLLTNNLIFGNDVVVDYILDYPTTIEILQNVLASAKVRCECKYTLLLAEPDTIRKRDAQRPQADRCWPAGLTHTTILKNACPPNHVIDTQSLSPNEVADKILEVKEMAITF